MGFNRSSKEIDSVMFMFSVIYLFELNGYGLMMDLDVTFCPLHCGPLRALVPDLELL